MAGGIGCGNNLHGRVDRAQSYHRNISKTSYGAAR